MKRWWVVIALLLSVGFNLGLLAALAGGWWADRGDDTPLVDGGPGVGEEWHPGDGGPGPGARPGHGPGPMPGPGPRGGPPLDRVADHLGLEGETRQRFLEVQRRFVSDMARARLRRAAIDRDLRLELTAAEPDEARIEELTAAKAELVLSVERATARTILETRGLLDPEQQRRYLHVLQRLRGASGRRSPP